MKHTKLINLIKCILFAAILFIIVLAPGKIFKPIYDSWPTHDRDTGFYLEPSNTIETIFLGASTMQSGIAPTELFKTYGICAYNFSSANQPVSASYYWTKEVYKLHPDTLDTVVLDASMLRKNPSKEECQRAIDGMKLSLNKWEAVGAYTNSIQERLLYFFPFFEYHSRWDQLKEADFKKEQYVNDFVRGYNFSSIKRIDNALADTESIAEYEVDETTGNTKLDASALYYFEALAGFCHENNLNLVILKTPTFVGWSDFDYNAIKKVADRYGVDYIDYNYEPYLSELSLSEETDYIDGMHPNYYGACKLTNSLGEHLINDYGNKDVRDDDKYAFLRKQLLNYKYFIKGLLPSE